MVLLRTLVPHEWFMYLPSGVTALHIAASQGNLSMITLLLRAHVRMNGAEGMLLKMGLFRFLMVDHHSDKLTSLSLV